MELHPPSYYLTKSAEHLAISFNLLSIEEAESLRRNVFSKFAPNRSKVIWHDMLSSTSIHDPNGWKLIDNYLSGASFILFFDEQEDKSMFEFHVGTRLTPILAECPGFEFYLTDRTATYLLCFNDHDYLIGAGSAEAWVAKYLHGTAG